MVKKLFALASVTALAGLVSAVGVAGCSETVVEPAATPDAGTDSGKPKTDSGPVTGDDDDDDVDPPSCATKDPIDATKFPYKKAEQTAGACTAAELKKLTDWFAAKVDANEQNISVAEWKAEASAACGECIFSAEGDATWGPLVVKDDKLDFVNQGGCIEIASGKESCGRAYQQVNVCMLEACLEKCTTQAEFDACRQDSETILGGPCKDALAALQTECGSSLQAYMNACKNTKWTFDAPFVKQCGGTAPDAGN